MTLTLPCYVCYVDLKPKRGTTVKVKYWLLPLVVALNMGAAGCREAEAPAKPTREELARQADRLAMAMLSWELQGPQGKQDVCRKAVAAGQMGTQRTWQAQQGGAVGDWSSATSWLLKQCETEGYGS